MTHNFKVGDIVETIGFMPSIGKDGKQKYRRNRLSGNMTSVWCDDWQGRPETVEAIDCGKTKRIKVGGNYYMPHRIRAWNEVNRKNEHGLLLSDVKRQEKLAICEAQCFPGETVEVY